MDSLVRDLRFAARSLLRTPGFTAAAVLALALGIGATTALFTVAHAVLMRSLGWGEESQLVAIREAFEGQNLEGLTCSAPEYLDFKKAHLFQSVGVYYGDTAVLQGERAERISVGYATGSFFTALGVQPALGRNFTEDEDQAGKNTVALLSWASWQKRFASDPAAIGRTVTVNGRPRTVVGILPASFRWEKPHELYTPFGWTPRELQEERGNRYLNPVARLRPGLAFEAAQREMAALVETMRAENPKWYHGESRWTAGLVGLRDRFVGAARQPILILLGAVLFVLLIACANVANLLLARGAARSRELAVRTALGASRGRLVRLLLAESALLSLVGTTAGVLVAGWALDILLVAAPQAVKQLVDVGLDRSVLAFAAALAVLTTFLFGLVPALQATRVELVDSLKDGAQTTSSRRAGRLRGALVVGQFALSLMLLVGAGLLLRSFAEILDVQAGFDPKGVLAAKVSLGGPAYEKAEVKQRYWAEAVRRLSARPGVEVVGGINIGPLEGTTDWSYEIQGYVRKPGEAEPDDQFRRITPGYFRALGIQVKQGRELTAADDAKAPEVSIVNQAWVRRYFPGQDVLGRGLRIFGKEGKWRPIVGVVADSHDGGLDKPTQPMFFMATAQFDESETTLMVKSTVAPQALAEVVRAELAAIDAGQPPEFVEPLENRIALALSPRRFPLQLLAAFAALALVLSALGIYGVTSYAVTLRTREFGVRLAIGAQARDVMREVMAGAGRLAALGVTLGLCGALAFASLLSSQLYGVSARDPLTYLGISGLLAMVALAASYFPARRATRVDPATALRAE